MAKNKEDTPATSDPHVVDGSAPCTARIGQLRAPDQLNFEAANHRTARYVSTSRTGGSTSSAAIYFGQDGRATAHSPELPGSDHTIWQDYKTA